MTRRFRIGKPPPPGRTATAEIPVRPRPENDRTTDPYIGGVEAAFFDLDKTVIARASIMAFARDFRREGLLTRRTMAKGLWTQLVYVHVGASSKKLDRIRRSVLSRDQRMGPGPGTRDRRRPA